MSILINKDAELIKDYIELRKKIIDKVRNSSEEEVDEYYKRKLEYILEEDKTEWLVSAIDDGISKNKMSEKIYKFLIRNYSEGIHVVEHKYILGSTDDMMRNYSFETMEELNAKIEELKEDAYADDYDPMGDYEILETKVRKGTIEDNYDWMIDRYENGWMFFIKADSIYNDDIEIAYIED